MDGQRWDEIEKSKQAPQTRTKNGKPIDFRDCSFDALIQLNIMKVCYNGKAAFFTHLTHDMQFYFIYAEFRINCKAGRSYRVYSEIKKILDRDKSMKNQYKSLFNLSFSLLNLIRDEYKYTIKYLLFKSLFLKYNKKYYTHANNK